VRARAKKNPAGQREVRRSLAPVIATGQSEFFVQGPAQAVRVEH
jgi:hypothetical protein